MGFGFFSVSLIAVVGLSLILLLRQLKSYWAKSSTVPRWKPGLSKVLTEVLLPPTVAASAFSLIAAALVLAHVSSVPIGVQYVLQDIRNTLLSVLAPLKSPIIALVVIVACLAAVILGWKPAPWFVPVMRGYRKWIGRIAGVVAACAYFTLFGPALGQRGLDLQPRIEAVEREFSRLRSEVHLALATKTADRLVAQTIAASAEPFRKALEDAEDLRRSLFSLSARYDSVGSNLSMPLREVEQALGRDLRMEAVPTATDLWSRGRMATPKSRVPAKTSLTIVQAAHSELVALQPESPPGVTEASTATGELSRDLAGVAAKLVTALLTPLASEHVRGPLTQLTTQFPIMSAVFGVLTSTIEEIGLKPRLEAQTERIIKKLSTGKVDLHSEITREVALTDIPTRTIQPTPADWNRWRRATASRRAALGRVEIQIERTELQVDVGLRITELDRIWTESLRAAPAPNEGTTDVDQSAREDVARHGETSRRALHRRLAQLSLTDRKTVLTYLKEIAEGFETGLERSEALILGASGRQVPRIRTVIQKRPGELDLEELSRVLEEARQTTRGSLAPLNIPHREERLLLNPDQPELKLTYNEPAIGRTFSRYFLGLSVPPSSGLRQMGRLGAKPEAQATTKPAAEPEALVAPPRPSIHLEQKISPSWLDRIESHLTNVVVSHPPIVRERGPQRPDWPYGNRGEWPRSGRDRPEGYPRPEPYPRRDPVPRRPLRR